MIIKHHVRVDVFGEDEDEDGFIMVVVSAAEVGLVTDDDALEDVGLDENGVRVFDDDGDSALALLIISSLTRFEYISCLSFKVISCLKVKTPSSEGSALRMRNSRERLANLDDISTNSDGGDDDDGTSSSLRSSSSSRTGFGDGAGANAGASAGASAGTGSANFFVASIVSTFSVVVASVVVDMVVPVVNAGASAGASAGTGSANFFVASIVSTFSVVVASVVVDMVVPVVNAGASASAGADKDTASASVLVVSIVSACSSSSAVVVGFADIKYDAREKPSTNERAMRKHGNTTDAADFPPSRRSCLPSLLYCETLSAAPSAAVTSVHRMPLEILPTPVVYS